MTRHLGTPSVFAIATGAMFSSGFFLLPGIAADESGASVPLVYLVAGLCMLPAIFSIGELASAMPRAGGPYIFLTRGLGPMVGTIGAVGIFLQLLFKGAFAFVGVGVYLSLIIDVPIEFVAVGLIVFFTALNLIGVQQTATTEKIMVAVLLLLLVYFVTAGFTEILTTGISFKEQVEPIFPFGFMGFISAVALISVSYGGFQQVASISEEIKEPSKAIPKGMIWGLVISTFFYVTGTAIMVLLISPEALRDDNTPVATVAELIRRLPLPILGVVIAALAAFASTGNAAILSAARYPLALARDNLIWSEFGRLDKKGVPRLAVIFTGLALTLLVVAFDVENLAKYGSVFLLLAFTGLSVAVIVFRESKLKEYRPGYKSPLYPWIQILGIFIYLALIGLSGVDALAFIFFVVALSVGWYFGKGRKRVRVSGAIYNLFGRLARHVSQESHADVTSVPVFNDLSGLVKRAIVLSHVKDEGYTEVTEHIAKVLKDRIGGGVEELTRSIRQESESWSSPLTDDIAVSSILLEDIEQPEMIILKGKIVLNGKSFSGLIVMVDDKEAPERFWSYLSSLSDIIRQPEFSNKWRKASKPEEIKEALIQDIRTISFTVGDETHTASMVGKDIGKLGLPEGSRIMTIQRDGRQFVPKEGHKLEKNDKISIIAEKDALEKIKGMLG
ncbi:amino acid permease [Cytophagaceae bacterium ABcell3]|nr:amino acid permease [Cytophagaceae bacterium ABcell3]